MKAFPRQHAVADANDPAFKLGQDGMDLRDYFAAAAMQAIVSKIPLKQHDITSIPPVYAEAANGAYAYADAMMAARNNNKE